MASGLGNPFESCMRAFESKRMRIPATTFVPASASSISTMNDNPNPRYPTDKMRLEAADPVRPPLSVGVQMQVDLGTLHFARWRAMQPNISRFKGKVRLYAAQFLRQRTGPRANRWTRNSSWGHYCVQLAAATARPSRPGDAVFPRRFIPT